jgi:hypothetical protein
MSGGGNRGRGLARLTLPLPPVALQSQTAPQSCIAQDPILSTGREKKTADRECWVACAHVWNSLLGLALFTIHCPGEAALLRTGGCGRDRQHRSSGGSSSAVARPLWTTVSGGTLSTPPLGQCRNICEREDRAICERGDRAGNAQKGGILQRAGVSSGRRREKLLMNVEETQI